MPLPPVEYRHHYDSKKGKNKFLPPERLKINFHK
ncbi:hypothetical protein FIC_00193 [Flavobacteriaceae bacterium 3519-10]|nr:hypothetical protein FIC_00193 [Flavobacteriaceae bacterium 3519-10]